VTHFKLGNTG